MTSPVTKGDKEEFLANARVVKVFAKNFGIGQWSFIGPGLKRSGILEKRITHKELEIISRTKSVGIRRKRTSYFPCNDSIVQVYSQEQRTWKTVNTFHCRLSNN